LFKSFFGGDMKCIYGIVLLMFAISISIAEIPKTISWQGQLQDSGENYLDGTYDLTITIYDQETGGEPIWTEQHEEVLLKNGLVSLIMGSITPLNISFDRQLWLEIQIEDSEPLDRIKLTSTPYSFYTSDIRDNSITAEKIANGAVNSQHIDRMNAEQGQVLTWNTSWTPTDIPEETDPIFNNSPSKDITANMIGSWTEAYGWGDHSLSGYLTNYTETDPVYIASPASGINNNMIGSWTEAYGWGDHSVVGYLTDYTETDPIYINSASSGITNNMIGSWTDAYGWGDHSLAGYLTGYTETDPFFNISPSKDITTNMINSWTDAYGWGDHSVVGYLTEYT
jgi:hypothetical protein